MSNIPHKRTVLLPHITVGVSSDLIITDDGERCWYYEDGMSVVFFLWPSRQSQGCGYLGEKDRVLRNRSGL